MKVELGVAQITGEVFGHAGIERLPECLRGVTQVWPKRGPNACWRVKPAGQRSVWDATVILLKTVVAAAPLRRRGSFG